MRSSIRRRLAAFAAASGLLGGCGGAPQASTDVATTEDGTLQRIFHGELPDQFGDLYLPATQDDALLPVVVLVHGGFWRDSFRLDLMDPLARDLQARGYAAWNIEYRRVGGAGGHPATFVDVAAAIDQLAKITAPLDLDRVVVVGHSAGGHLAVWAAGRHVLPAGSPGAEPVIRPCAAVSQAGVLDLRTALDTRLGGNAAGDLLGPDAPTLVATTSPIAMLPIGVPVLLSHGVGDNIVPLRQSQDYAAAAGAAGDRVIEAFGPGGHFNVIDPADQRWLDVIEALPGLCAG